MPPVNGPQQNAPNGKKANNKGMATTKRKTNDETTQRRHGCSVLLQSGCRIGELVDPNNSADAVKMVCQNPKCEYSPFVHRRCYDEWEKLLVSVMATTSWSRSWTDAQRRSNLWDKKGYQLIAKMCWCLCDKGHVRRDLDYKPPGSEDAAKKKTKKAAANKALPVLKNPESKVAGFAGKQPPPNAVASSSYLSGSSTTTTTTTYEVTRSKAAKRSNFGQDGFEEQCDPQYAPSNPPPSSATFRVAEKCGTRSFFNQPDASSRSCFQEVPYAVLDSNLFRFSADDECDEGERLCESLNEFDSHVIPCVRSLLRWKNSPVLLNDPILMEILNGCSIETRKKISDVGGLAVALAQTGYFVVGADAVRLKENGIEAQDAETAFYRRYNNELPPRLRSNRFGNLPLYHATTFECDKGVGSTNIADPASFEEAFSLSAQSGTANHVENHCSISSVSPPFNCNSLAETTELRPQELTDARSFSSGFDEESMGSVKSVSDLYASFAEAAACFAQAMQHQDSIDSGWQPFCEYGRSVQFYNSSIPGQFIASPVPFPTNAFRPFQHPSASQLWYCREYKLFEGPSFEDLFRRAMPRLYNGTNRRFEPTCCTSESLTSLGSG